MSILRFKPKDDDVVADEIIRELRQQVMNFEASMAVLEWTLRRRDKLVLDLLSVDSEGGHCHWCSRQKGHAEHCAWFNGRREMGLPDDYGVCIL